ncbi:MAG: hypothetical protein OM95_00860 [Bdellovibrio sp. ArHS]|nr:MAG: hypothetical protein OM95_00860 [Bdellovibrio sp. ArHS]
MLSIKSKSTHAELDHILNFVDASKGLRAKINESGRVQIRQDLDGKLFSFNSQEVNEVLHRADSEGKPFIQVNFKNGTKVLLTETLVGFKPLETLGLDMGRIPKVVTTPDLVSVFDAIEESLGADNGLDHEVEILKKVYMAIVSGGEKVGFDLTTERAWLNRLVASKFKASA